ncbi:MAG: hypothetical protein EXQ56_01400 [Acidobacteria bacterium]|nr:hypothetical protein [Acidobacteriota bacterium]
MAALLLVCIALGGQSAEPKSLAELEQALSQQKDSRKRARLTLEMLDHHLLKIRTFVATGTMMEESNSILLSYTAALARLSAANSEAAHTGTARNIEVGLRRHSRELEQIQINVSSDERPLIEAVMKQVLQLREAVLYSVMHPPSKK